MGPNLFKFATSELSQDAIISWIFDWADPKYKERDKELNKCGENLICRLLKKHGKEIRGKIREVEIKPQHKNLDILCVVNNEYAIIVEDKTGTKNHGDQLKRYIKTIEKDYPLIAEAQNIIPIYFKTGDQSDYEDIFDAGYQRFSREEFLELLNECQSNNSIFCDYKNHLQNIQEEFESFGTESIENWGWRGWQGFYTKLKEELNISGWDYVANKSGGFLGCWWYFKGNEECEQYLQLEQNKLCIKVWVKEKYQRSELRNFWSKKVLEEAAKRGLNLKKPKFGFGEYMTIAIDENYRLKGEGGRLDFDETLKLLRSYEKLLDSICNE